MEEKHEHRQKRCAVQKFAHPQDNLEAAKQACEEDSPCP